MGRIGVLLVAAVLVWGAETPTPTQSTQNPPQNPLLQAYQRVKQRSKLSLKLQQFLVHTYKDKHGKMRVEYRPVGNKYKIKKRDILEYRITAINNTKDETLRNIKIRGMIPTAMVYIPKSAKPADALFSIDGGKSFKRPPIKYFVIENGKKVQKVATPDMYTNIEWTLKELKPKQKTVFRYWVKLNPKIKPLPKGGAGTRNNQTTQGVGR
jgi:hypothetical protein